MILVAPIILYVILFGYIATFNLDYVPYALLDLSQSKASAEFARRIDASPVFERVRTLSNTGERLRAYRSSLTEEIPRRRSLQQAT